MSGRTLMHRTLEGQQKEQIPVTPHWWGLYKFQMGHLISGYEEERKAWDLRGEDLAKYDMEFYEEFKPDMFHLTTGKHKKGNIGDRKEYQELKRKLRELDHPDDVDHLIDYIYESEKDVIESGVFDHVKILSERYESSFIALNEGNPICRVLDEYLGFEDGLVGMLENPELVGYLLYRLYDILLPRMRALKQMGVDAYIGSETYCTPDIISPAMYRDLVFPAQRHFYTELEKMGLLPITYFLGDVNPMIEDINRLGIKGLMVEESKKGFELNVTELRKQLNPEITLFGNLDSVYILQKGNIREVQEETRKQLKAAEYGSFVMANGCPISFGTPKENIHAMMETVREYEK